MTVALVAAVLVVVPRVPSGALFCPAGGPALRRLWDLLSLPRQILWERGSGASGGGRGPQSLCRGEGTGTGASRPSREGSKAPAPDLLPLQGRRRGSGLQQRRTGGFTLLRAALEPVPG